MNLILDFDNTIANSAETAIRHIWNKNPTKYKVRVDYSQKDLFWNFAPFLDEKDAKEALDYMGTQPFFDELWQSPEGKDEFRALKKCLEVLYTRFDIILCTNRSGTSFDLVKNWIAEKGLDKYFSNYICVSNFDKSVINGDVIVDDKIECLFGQRKLAIPFGFYRYTVNDLFEKIGEFEQGKTLPIKNWQDFLSRMDDILDLVEE